MRRRARVSGRLLALTIFCALVAACFSERSDPAAVLPEGCLELIDPALIDPAHTLVGVRDFEFQPAEVRVPAGTTVTWVNCEEEGNIPHTSTSDDEVWSSPLFSRGEIFSRTFDQAGSYSYRCAPHPFMQGSVVVE